MNKRILSSAVLLLLMSSCATYTERPLTADDEAALSAIPFHLSPAARKVFVENTLVTSGAKAFAASPDGAFGYGHRYHNLENAEKAAFNNCSNKSATCQIVYAVQSKKLPLENGVRLSDYAYLHYQTYLQMQNPKIFVIGYGGHFNMEYGPDIKKVRNDALTPCSAAMRQRTYPDGCVVLSINGELLDIEQPMRPTLPYTP